MNTQPRWLAWLVLARCGMDSLGMLVVAFSPGLLVRIQEWGWPWLNQASALTIFIVCLALLMVAVNCIRFHRPLSNDYMYVVASLAAGWSLVLAFASPLTIFVIADISGWILVYTAILWTRRYRGRQAKPATMTR